jgi:chemotaxis protein CheZ
MAAPRKVFRIEEMTARHSAPQADAADRHDQETARQLDALRAMLAKASPPPIAESNTGRRGEIERLASELRLVRAALCGSDPDSAVRTAQITKELQAVMHGSEQATQKILAAAEDIDQAANNLSASLKGESERDLAQDIRDRVIHIFEACNFQDLTSQRVAKVLAALRELEQQIARAVSELVRADVEPPMHGPRLPNDPGHLSQGDIDAMFDADA